MTREALVVGINRYPFLKDPQSNQPKHLKTPAADAEAVAQLLEKFGNFHVRRFPEKTNQNRRQVDPEPCFQYPGQRWMAHHLEDAITQLFCPPEDMPETALLFFAGHGLPKAETGSEGFSGTRDVFLGTSNVFPEKGHWGVSLQWLRELLEISPVRQQIVWLDCCFSGSLFHFVEEDLGICQKPRDRFFITASRSNEQAYEEWSKEHGVLSGVLLEALNPTKRLDGLVTNYSIADFIKHRLRSAGQRPICKHWGGKIVLTEIIESPPSGFTSPDYEEFYGRQAELTKLENLVLTSRILVIFGESGVGKTYLAAQLAKELSREYKICWLYKEEGFSLDEFLLQFNEFLKANREDGFDPTYAENKIKSLDKGHRLVEFLSRTEIPYAVFIDGFQRAHHQEFHSFFEKFRTTKSYNKIILIDHAPEKSLGHLLAGKVNKLLVEGFKYSEAVGYINRGCEGTGQCSSEDVDAIFNKTLGHPLAIDLIMQWRGLLGVSMQMVLDRLVEYDERYGKELSNKLLANVKALLDEEQQQALICLSVFRTPVQRSAWSYLDISERVGDSLVHRRLLTRMDGDRFQMHPLIAEFWRKEPSPEEMLIFRHEQAARYYGNLKSQGQLESFERSNYLESYYHWLQSKNVEKAAQVIDELVSSIHHKERLPSERLPGLTAWLLGLPDNIFEGKPWLLLEKGRKLEKQFRLPEAEEIFERAFQVFKQDNLNYLGAFVALFYVGKMRSLRQKPKSALIALESVLSMAEDRVDIPMQIRTLGKMIGCYLDMGEYRKALNTASLAENLTQLDDRLGLALIWYRKGSIERHQSNYSQAEEFFKKSANLFEELKDIYRQSKSLSRLGVCQKFQGKLDEAIPNLEQAIKLKWLICDRHGLARDWDYLADIYTLKRNFVEAEKLYKKSLQIKEKNNSEIQPDLYGQIKTYNNLARLNLLRGRLEQVDKFIQESAKRIKKHNEEHSGVNVSIGLNGSRLMIQGDLEYSQGKYEQALNSYQEALTCFTSPNPKIHSSCARISFSMGRTYLAMAYMTQAEKYFQESLAAFKTYDMDYYQALVLTYLARWELFVGCDQAADFNQKACEIAIKINSDSVLAVCLETKALLEEHKLLQIISDQHYMQTVKNEDIEFFINSIWRCWDEVKTKLVEQQVLDIARVEIKKILWLLVVKDLYQKPIHPDDAYGLLKNKELARDIIWIELLNAKYFISNLPAASSSTAILQKVAEYVQRVLSPLAVRFGFNQLREEIDDLAFAFLEPEQYEQISQTIERRFPNPDGFRENLIGELEDQLELAEVNAEIQVRMKSIYSIYQKMKARHVSLDKILDIVGVRIIAQTERECYQALTIVQEMGSFFQGEGILKESLRDYIEKPKKSTGYQSIHINIYYGKPNPQIVEFQIRTETMHWLAEYGISVLGLDSSAHRYYKDPAHYARPLSQHNYEYGSEKKIHLLINCNLFCIAEIGNVLQNGKLELGNSIDIDRSEDMQILLLLEMVGKKQKFSAYQPGELEEAISKLVREVNKINGVLKVELSSLARIADCRMPLEEKQKIIQLLTEKSSQQDNYIYLFTPQGDVKKILKEEYSEKSKKITPVDFAYKIHEEVGNHCAGAKVNGKIVKLNTPLRNGDIVEILTDKNAHPSLDWLGFVITPTAKHRISRWYKRVHREENIVAAREKLQKELGTNSLKSLLDSEEMQRVIQQCNYHNVDDWLAAIGHGDLSLNYVVNRIQETIYSPKNHQKLAEISGLQPFSSGTSLLGEISSRDSSAILGIEGMPYRLAGCCNPVPGQLILGIVTRRGRDIAIHTHECTQAKNSSKEQWIPAEWNQEQNQIYTTWIEIEVINRPGELNNITNILKKLNINIQNMRRFKINTESGTAVIPLCIEISDIRQLERVLVQIKKMENCLNVRRKTTG